MSSDTKWVIGTGISLAGVLLLAMLAQFAAMNSRIDDLGRRIDDLEDRLESRIDDLEDRLESRIDDLEIVIRGLDERLRTVEVDLAEVKVLIAGDDRDPLSDARP